MGPAAPAGPAYVCVACGGLKSAPVTGWEESNVSNEVR